MDHAIVLDDYSSMSEAATNHPTYGVARTRCLSTITDTIHPREVSLLVIVHMPLRRVWPRIERQEDTCVHPCANKEHTAVDCTTRTSLVSHLSIRCAQPGLGRVHDSSTLLELPLRCDREHRRMRDWKMRAHSAVSAGGMNGNARRCWRLPLITPPPAGYWLKNPQFPDDLLQP